MIVTDDVGYGDIGSYGARDVKTPSIDSLARDGVRLTDFYGRRDTACALDDCRRAETSAALTASRSSLSASWGGNYYVGAHIIGS